VNRRYTADNLLQTASLIPGGEKRYFYRADSYPSRSASILLQVQSGANQTPQRRICGAFPGSHRCTMLIGIFTATIKPSQPVFISISGYSLALDAETKNFPK
jgi:hypothetical protein